MENAVSARVTPAKGWANLPLRWKGLAAASLPVVALVISFFLFQALQRAKDEAAKTLQQAQEFRAQLQIVYIVLIEAESSVRNYALTGHEVGLQSLGMVRTNVDTVLDKVRDLEHGNADQLQRLSDLRQLAHQRLAGLEQLRDFYDAHKADHQPPPPELLAKARISPDVLLAVSALGAPQGRIVQDQTRVSQTAVMHLLVAIGVCVVVGLIGGLLAVLLFTTGLVRRVRLLESASVQLETGRIPTDLPGGNDELGRLAKALERAGAILASRDRELRLALENAQLLIWDLNLENYQIRYHAGAAAEDSILPVELLAPTVNGWISGIHPEDRELVRGNFERVSSNGDVLNTEYRVVIRGGETRWMAVRAQRHGAGNGSPERLLGVLADITERRNAAVEIERQAQELAASKLALERQTRILQSILDNMGDGVVVADTNGKFLVFNPAARQVLGSRSFAGDPGRWSEHYGLFLSDCVTLYPDDDLPFVRAIRGESVDNAELFVKPAGAREGRWTSVTARPLRTDEASGDGDIAGGIMVLRDITAAKRNAEALEQAKREAEDANQAKSEFLSRMSHELRTPLNSILGFAQLLELAELTDQDRDNVEHILKGGYHLLDLINEILDLARIEAGRLSLSPEPVRLREAVKDAVDLVRPLAAEREINLSPETAIRADYHVRADRQRLKQVLLNLLSNAIKYNRAGGSVVFSCALTPENRLRFEIADSGAGISADGLKRIFRPFERLTADQTDVGGSGLGLALCRRLIEAMGGTIGVESTIGIGSKFFIELEMLEDPTAALADDPAMAELAADDNDARRGTILYIEDNPSNLRLIERIMEHCPGVRLITAMQGQLGLDLAQMHVPDWILLDLHLPDIGGEEVLKRLRAHPRTQAIPVTVLSADATRPQITRMLNAGARDYLTKPVDVRQLLALLDQTLAPDLETAHAQRDHSE
jgi:signal transduction histidine kinase/ActR/RegA family two-component response regulator